MKRADASLTGTVICPRGKSQQAFQNAGLLTIEVPGLPQWDDTRVGYYRGLRWLILLREIALWFPALFALRRLRRANRFDLIHANELTLLFPALLAKRWFKAPLIVHVRSLQRGAKGDFRTRWINRLLSKYASAVVAIDQTVRGTLPADMPVEIVHNTINLQPPSTQATRTGDSCKPRIGIVGVLSWAKGVYEFVEAARICRDRGLEAEFLVVGENIRPIQGLKGVLLRSLNFSKDVRSELEASVVRYGLQDCVKFTGFVNDTQSIFQTLDILCFPSHLNAAGRPVFEAAFFGVPSIVASRYPTSDTIEDGKTGLCISEPSPELLANAIERLLQNPQERIEMGERARLLAENTFAPELNAIRMLQIYHRITVHSPEQA
jgi:glycosyltransferase involved in cell wall biosynthesis